MCEDLKSEIKLKRKEFRELCHRDFKKELSYVRNRMNLMSKPFDEVKEMLGINLKEKKEELKAASTAFSATCGCLINQAKPHESQILRCEQLLSESEHRNYRNS